MKNNDKKATQRLSKLRKGFSLIELIVVIAVLGVLTAIVAPRLGGVTTAAQTNARKEQVLGINTMLDAFQAAGGTFGAAYVAGNASISGTIRNDTAANLLTDIASPTFASGMTFQVGSTALTTTSSVWNGNPPVIVNSRIQ